MPTLSFSRAFLAVVALFTALVVAPGYASPSPPPPLRVLVQSGWPEPLSRAAGQWLQAVAQKATGTPTSAEVLPRPELEAQLAAQTPALLLMDPVQASLASSRGGVMLLARLPLCWNSECTVASGAAVWAPRENAPQRLEALAGKTILTPDARGLAALLVRAEWQRRGLPAAALRWQENDDLTAAWQAVAQGQAAALVLESGVAEALPQARNQPLALIEPQQLPHYPFAVSTPLLGGRFVALTPTTPAALAQAVAQALWQVPPPAGDGPVTLGAPQPPLLTQQVPRLLQALGEAPFATPKAERWEDLSPYLQRWAQAGLASAGALLLALVAVVALALALRRSRRQGLQDRALLHAVIEHLPAPLYIVRSDGTLEYVNPAAMRVLGFDEADLAEAQLHERFHHHHPEAQPHLPKRDCPVYQTFLDGQPHRAKTTFWNKDEQPIAVEVAVAPLFRSGKRLPGAAVVTFQDVSDTERLLAELRALADHDALTGLPNRRAWEARLEEAHALMQRYGTQTSVAVLDLDHFKQVNDSHGHTAGDAVLQALAQTLRRTLRPSDFVARIGGEEFAVLLPHTGLDEAVKVLDRLRRRWEQQPILLPDGTALHSTLSAGVATLDPTQPAKMALERADAALYRAKQQGRNQVELPPPWNMTMND